MKLKYGPYMCKDGRYRCDVMYKAGVKTVLYARYKLEKHLGRKLTKYETVDHLDEDPTNDRLSNLQVLSLSENTKKSMRLNPERHARMLKLAHIPQAIRKRALKVRGEQNTNSVLTDKQVIHLRKIKNIDRKAICQQYGISDKTLRNVLSGVTYSHLPYANTRWKRTDGNRLGRPGKLTDKQVMQLRKTTDFDIHKAIKKYGVSREVIYAARSGKTHSHLTGAVSLKQAKFTDEQVIAIRRLKNFDSNKLAKKYGVSKRCLYDARSGKTYKHLLTGNKNNARVA